MMPARTSCSGDVSHGEVNIEETDGSSSGQKEYDLPVLVMEAYGLKWRRSFPPWHPVLGRSSLDWKMTARTKSSVEEANSRSAAVEPGERTCWRGVICETVTWV